MAVSQLVRAEALRRGRAAAYLLDREVDYRLVPAADSQPVREAVYRQDQMVACLPVPGVGFLLGREAVSQLDLRAGCLPGPVTPVTGRTFRRGMFSCKSFASEA